MIASRLFAPTAMILFATGHLAAQDAVSSPNPLAALDRETLKAFVEQPLLEPSRRPPTVAPPPVYVAPSTPALIAQPPSLRLLGLVESNRSIFAVVYRNDTGKTETLRPGDHIGNWVVQITAANLRVISGDRAFEYRLFRGGPSQRPVAVDVLPSPELAIPAIAARNPSTSAR